MALGEDFGIFMKAVAGVFKPTIGKKTARFRTFTVAAAHR